MDHFTIPQFIEEKAKVIGPLTLTQFFYIGTAGGICFVLYFIAPRPFFFLSSIFIITGGIVLAFGKFKGRPLPTMFRNFIFFKISPKIYLWKKKTGSPLRFIQAPKSESIGIKKSPVPTIIGKSRLKDLSSQVENRTQ